MPATSSSSSSAHPHTLTIQQKRQLLKAAERDHATTIMQRYRIKKSTYYDILRSKVRILEAFHNGTDEERRRLKSPKYRQLEDKLFKWIWDKYQQGSPISGPVIREKAKQLGETLKQPSFKASNGWLDKFKHRYNIELFRGGGVRILPRNQGTAEEAIEEGKTMKTESGSEFANSNGKDVLDAIVNEFPVKESCKGEIAPSVQIRKRRLGRPPKKRGRPRLVKSDLPSSAESMPIRRKRGRPRIVRPESELSAESRLPESSSFTSIAPPMKKKRGRPRKNQSAVVASPEFKSKSSFEKEELKSAPKKRGRPRLNREEARKSELFEAESTDTVVESTPRFREGTKLASDEKVTLRPRRPVKTTKAKLKTIEFESKRGRKTVKSKLTVADCVEDSEDLDLINIEVCNKSTSNKLGKLEGKTSEVVKLEPADAGETNLELEVEEAGRNASKCSKQPAPKLALVYKTANTDLSFDQIMTLPPQVAERTVAAESINDKLAKFKSNGAETSKSLPELVETIRSNSKANRTTVPRLKPIEFATSSTHSVNSTNTEPQLDKVSVKEQLTEAAKSEPRSIRVANLHQQQHIAATSSGANTIDKSTISKMPSTLNFVSKEVSSALTLTKPYINKPIISNLANTPNSMSDASSARTSGNAKSRNASTAATDEHGREKDWHYTTLMELLRRFLPDRLKQLEEAEAAERATKAAQTGSNEGSSAK